MLEILLHAEYSLTQIIWHSKSSHTKNNLTDKYNHLVEIINTVQVYSQTEDGWPCMHNFPESPITSTILSRSKYCSSQNTLTLRYSCTQILSHPSNLTSKYSRTQIISQPNNLAPKYSRSEILLHHDLTCPRSTFSYFTSINGFGVLSVYNASDLCIISRINNYNLNLLNYPGYSYSSRRS